MIFCGFSRTMPVFEPPFSSRDVGYLSNGSGRVRELQGRPLMRETRQVRRRECQTEDTFRDFDFVSRALIFCDYRPFYKPRKLSFRRQHPLSLTTTSPLPHNNHPDTALMPSCPNCQRGFGRIAAILHAFT